jgi:hypothetical protein
MHRVIIVLLIKSSGARGATNRQVAGSTPDGVIGIFQ